MRKEFEKWIADAEMKSLYNLTRDGGLYACHEVQSAWRVFQVGYLLGQK